MNDIITASGFDLTKNLHGHVRVETRSRWTGRVVDSQEKDNLVTNALQKVAAATVWQTGTYAAPKNWFPVYEQLLGSVMLFSDTLTESATNIAFPNKKLVGYAGQTSNTSSAYSGSYNASESTPISNGFTSVWDFLTSQANGTIASVGRTSSYFASNFLVASSAGNVNYAYGKEGKAITSYSGLGYDETNQYFYFAPYSSTTIDGVTYTSSQICRVKAPYDKINLYGGFPPQITVVKTLTSSDGTSSAYMFVYDKYADNFIYMTGTTLHIVATDGTHTTKTITGTTGSNFTVTENYYWRTGSSSGSNYPVYRITKSNTSDVVTYNVPYYASVAPNDGDVVFVFPTSSASWMCVLYPDGTSIELAHPSALNYNNYIRQNDILYSINPTNGNAGNNYVSSHYLGTIANLDSPVTKTSSQTMKITYTLTEA